MKQTKLSKAEWESIEIPASAQEKQILELIKDGFHNVNLTRNYTPTLIHHMKIANTPQIDDYIYAHYFQKLIDTLLNKYKIKLPASADTNEKEKKMPSLKKSDLIRLDNTSKHIEEQKATIFEFVLLDLLEKMLSTSAAGTSAAGTSKHKDAWLFYFYTLTNLLNYTVEQINANFRQKIIQILAAVEGMWDDILKPMVSQSYTLIEKNEYLLKYADETLYDHQKQLFTICKQPQPKLILYIAPTGTGKTLSPIGLSQSYRVIFVCAARHVGLALAKAAISVQKKVAFAFGCNAAEDIRLHYYAAKEYTKNAKSGGIGKVDNTQGEKVEIMISDVQSYVYAMYYMLAFNPKEKIIMYWDEPTITMDYPAHELHRLIQRNWTENLIPTVVLSSATLPHRNEISETITDFRARFMGAEVHEIVSYDCKKTIPLINREGLVEMPHYLFPNYDKILEVVQHCKHYKTLLRYLDLSEAVQTILFLEENPTYLKNNRYRIITHFHDIQTLNMYSVKMLYLYMLGNLNAEKWPDMYAALQSRRRPRYASTVNVVTTDAYTLTDGPTIFLADDVTKIAQFYIQSANIPEHVTREIMEKIQFNSQLNEQVLELEKEVEDGTAADEEKEKKSKNEERLSPEMKQKKMKISILHASIKTVLLNPMYVPNTSDHLYKYGGISRMSVGSAAFTCDISEDIVVQIMKISDVDEYWKLLLLMGIGVFASHKSSQYTEVMKKLAQEQRLYMIIVSSDYIYGTNYQFCHGYIGKDLGEMSQEKCIQSMGRVGRNKLQQDYSVRFRDNALLYKLFQNAENKPEVLNMNKLFNSIE